MNNPAIYSIEDAGGIPYPETESYQFDRWFTTVGLTDASEFKSIRFSMRQENLLLHWRYSYLEIHGQLVKNVAQNTPYAKDEKIALIFNAIPHLFSNGKLTVGTRTIENVNVIGHVSSMMHYVLFPRSKGKGDGLQYLWIPDTDNTTTDANKGFEIRRKYIINSPHTKGMFKFRIPMMMFFGFMENFVALKGYPVEIELVRGPDHSVILRGDAVDQGKLVFKDLLLNVPVVDPSKSVTLTSLRGISNPKPYMFSFRRRSGLYAPVLPNVQDFQFTITTESFVERPQMIWVGFQIGATVDQKFNYALYSHANVETMTIKMNNTQFPAKPIKANWTENDNGFFYEMQKHLRENYLQYPGTYNEGNMLNPVNFKDLCPIYCFDVTKQEYKVGSKTVTCELHVHFNNQTGAGLKVFVAWYSDRTCELFTDGKELNIKTETESFISH